MALIKCPDCGSQVSSSALACPSCGCPIANAKTAQKPKRHAGLTLFVVIFGIGLLVHWLGGKRESYVNIQLPQSKAASVETKKTCSPDDAECAFLASAGEATVDCQQLIEAKSEHTVKWDSSLGKQVFAYKGWNSNQHKELSLIGDAVKFQDDHGAWTPMSYACTFDLASRKATSVHVFVAHASGG
jgi:hypothetical protein